MNDLSTGLASTSNAAPAAPVSAPSTAESTPVTSIDQAFDQAITDVSAGESAPPTTAPETTQTPAPAPPIVEPPADPTAAVTPGTKGPVPFERHEAILKNARVKAQEDVAHQVQKEYGGLIQVGQALRQDFTGTLVQMLEEGLNDPSYSPALTTAIGRMLAGRRGVKTAVDEHTEPEADLQTADGQLVYSADRLKQWQQWNAKQTEQSTDAKLAPLMQQHQQQQAHLAINAAIQSRAEQARPTVESWMKQPHFKEHKTAILARQKELAQQGHEPWSAIGIAYAEVVNRQVLPQLTAHSQTSLLQQAADKLRASTDNPASTGVARSKPIRSIDDAFDQALAELGAARPSR